MYFRKPDQYGNRSVGAKMLRKYGTVHKDGSVSPKVNTSIQVHLQQYEEYVDELKPLRASPDFWKKVDEG